MKSVSCITPLLKLVMLSALFCAVSTPAKAQENSHQLLWPEQDKGEIEPIVPKAQFSATPLPQELLSQQAWNDENAESSQFSAFHDLWQTAGPVTQTIPPKTPVELKNEAITALSNNGAEIAEELLRELQIREFEPAFTSYALAWALTRQGRYAEALSEVDKLQKNYPNSGYFAPAEELAGNLILNLAETAQIRQLSKQADDHLRRYIKSHQNHNEYDRFVRLARTQGWDVKPKLPDLDQAPLFRIGLLLPLSGKMANTGQDLLRAAQLAMFEQGTPNLILYPEDTAGTPEGSRQAAQKLFDLGVDIILGPLTAPNVDAVAPFTRSSGVPLIAFSSDASVAGNNTYLLGTLPAEQGRIAAAQAVAESRTALATLVPDNRYGHEVFEAFKQTAVALGASITTSSFYDPNSSDISKALVPLLKLNEAAELLEKELKSLEKEYLILAGAMDDTSLTRLTQLRDAKPEPIINFDALFLPASSKTLALVASQLAFYDIDEKDILLLGTSRWLNDSTLQNRAEHLKGALFPAPPQNGSAGFIKAFKQAYGGNPSAIAILAYDGVNMIAQLVAANPDKRREVYRNLTRNEGFALSSGTVKLLPNGYNKRAYSIMQIGSRKFIERRKAPLVTPPELPQNLESMAQKQRPRSGFFWR